MKPKLAPCDGTLSPPTIAHYLQWHLQWHHPPKWAVTFPSTSTLQWHPAMAPSNGNTSTAPSNGTVHPSKWVITRLAHYTGTLQWHHPPPTIAHYNGKWHHVHSPKSSSSPSPHPTIAHYNGTLQWHPARPLPQSWSSPSQPQYTTMAPYNGTQQWHHVHCTLQWHPGAPSNPPKWFVALPPIRSKNPYSYRYLGNQESHHAKCSPPKNQYTRHMSKKMS